ncbi:MAG: Nudix family hydrolase [Alcanivorax sp.]|nr:Nudix family hydrolase [Alcanivorax sp.]
MLNTAPETPAITVVAAIIRGADGRICLSQRPAHKHQGGHWEFPGGKVEPGESLAAALARELSEELAMEQARSRPFMTIAHQYPDLHVTLHFREVFNWQGEPHGQEGQPVAWFPESDLSGLSFPAANRPVVTALTLPSSVAIAPAGQSLDDFLAAIPELDGEQTGLYLRHWSQHEAVDRIAAVCRRHGIRFWLRMVGQGDVDMAARLGALGLHLPASMLADCQQRPDFAGVVSAACHDAQEMDTIRALSLDMALVSPVQATRSHPQARPLGWPKAEAIMRGQPVACFALGGLAPDALKQARQHGAVGVAGIGAFWP